MLSTTAGIIIIAQFLLKNTETIYCGNIFQITIAYNDGMGDSMQHVDQKTYDKLHINITMRNV